MIAPLDVLLVSMPFGPLLSPSLGLSLLQPQLVSSGLTCRIEYFTLAFAEERRAEGVAMFHDLLVWARNLLRDRPDVRRRAHVSGEHGRRGTRGEAESGEAHHRAVHADRHLANAHV